MRYSIVMLALAMLAGCVTNTIDDKTGTTRADRCAGYQLALANIEAVQAVKFSEARETRLNLYRGLIAANCVEVK